jgi:DNA mismatch repair protein MutL
MTRKVAVLPEHIANKIAAGEVIQRPESVVKELLENSLDAGATSLLVVLKDAGKKLIQVTDNGSGMDEADAVASFLRHATSKISDYKDLEGIRTFGFRGEALASLAAVAQVTMKTRRAEDPDAIVVKIDGGGAPRISREGREPGTTILVNNLFFNVPARRKFLKSDTTEFRHVYDVVHRVAISRPDIALEFISNDETIFRLKPTSLPSRLAEVFGERQVEGLIPVEETSEFLSVRGFVGKPSFGQRTRQHQYIFLNGRVISNRNINHAVYSAYEHLLINGGFPFFLLFLDIDPERVDVNVHPSKMEVKFDDDQAVYRIVSSVTRRALAGSVSVPSATIIEKDSPEGGLSMRFTGRQHGWPGGEPQNRWTFPERQRVDTSTGEILPFAPRTMADGIATAGQLLSPEGRTTQHVPGQPVDGAQARPEVIRGEEADTNLIWQLHDKYILSQIRNGVMIVDQHVAHERILYERALDRFTSQLRSAQQLLFPQTVTLSPADAALLSELRPELQLLGFDISEFGKNTFLVEGLPSDVRPGQEERIVIELLEMYKSEMRDHPTDVRDALAKSFSCKSAIKAGDPLSEPEMRSLIDQLFATRMPYVCPHGRPVVLRISLDELDRRFGRT